MHARQDWKAALVGIVLIALALRLFGLDRMPLWWDEGNSVYFANQNLRTVVNDTRITNDTDPPAYRLALGGWRTLAGNSPFAVRLFSAWLGVLAVVLTWALGSWLIGQGTSLLAALFVAVAPMQVYYTREAKGYPFAMVCALLSAYAWGKRLGYACAAVSRHGALWWAVYVLSTTAAVATHYYVAPLLLWQGLWVMGRMLLSVMHGPQTRRQAWVRASQWMASAAAVVLLLTPWILIVMRTTVRGVTGLATEQAFSPWVFLERTSAEFVLGPKVAIPGTWIASLGLVALVIWGALTKDETRGHVGPFLLTWIAVPLLTAYLIQRLYPFFYPRFLLYLGPVSYLLVARGIGDVRRRLSIPAALAVVAAILSISILWVVRVYVIPVEPAEDPRPAIARIRVVAQPNDALVYVYVWQVGYLLSYYPQNTLSFYRAYYTPQSVGLELERVFSDHSRLWLLSYRMAAEDPKNLSASWLEAHAFKVESAWYGHHNLALYLAPDFRTPGVGPDEGTAFFDKRIELCYPLIDVRLRRGDAIALPLRWRALASLDEDYTVFLHLGFAGAPPLVQSDGLPRNALSPTSTWPVGKEILDRRVISLPEALPEGRYLIMVGLYRPSDGRRLPIDGTDGHDALILGHVQVER